MTEQETVLVHRYLYYVKGEPIISDQAYDELERALPDGDPVKESVGSSNAESYSPKIKRMANRLWKDHNE